MKSLKPAQILLVLVAIGMGVSGWAYGIYWKRVSSGTLFSQDEILMIRLQDQIRTLEKEVDLLQGRLREKGIALPDEHEHDDEDAPADTVAAPPKTNDPEALQIIADPLPLPQKIETH